MLVAGSYTSRISVSKLIATLGKAKISVLEIFFIEKKSSVPIREIIFKFLTLFVPIFTLTIKTLLAVTVVPTDGVLSFSGTSLLLIIEKELYSLSKYMY